MIELQNINVQFSGRDILKDISITFNPGEIIGLVAPNGTGKSTLMNVIMNYINPNSGKVVLNQELEYTSKKNEVKIHQLVSMMPDQSDLYNHISGKEHLKIYSSMWKSDPKLIASTIKELGMDSYINKNTGTYSLGMRQRLCFAMQIVSDTQVMLMDEVMNGLDPTHVELISQILLQKKSEGKTIIVASHLLENLEKYADRIFFFINGDLKHVNALSPGFDEKEITTARVTDVTDEIKEKFSKKFPKVGVQSLPNGATLIDVLGFDSEELGNVVEFLKENEVPEFSFGKVILTDLYSKYYQGIRVDIHETENEVVATCDILGLEKKEDVQINIENNLLHISGTVNRTNEVKDEHIHEQESYAVRFQRTISLPSPVSHEGVVATYRNGVLEIKMPKLEKTKKKIDVEFQ